jgi:hypothetical protein
MLDVLECIMLMPGFQKLGETYFFRKYQKCLNEIRHLLPHSVAITEVYK